MRSVKKMLAVFTVIALLFCGCAKSQEAAEEIAVDAGMDGEWIAETFAGISYRVPAGWEKYQEEESVYYSPFAGDTTALFYVRALPGIGEEEYSQYTEEELYTYVIEGILDMCLDDGEEIVRETGFTIADYPAGVIAYYSLMNGLFSDVLEYIVVSPSHTYIIGFVQAEEMQDELLEVSSVIMESVVLAVSGTEQNARAPMTLSADYPSVYEANDRIPDYSAVTGQKLLGRSEPGDLSTLWQHSYDYDATALEQYTGFLLTNGFEKTHAVGADISYYSKGAEGLYTVVSHEDKMLYVLVYIEGMANKEITAQSELWYKENEAVPNYGEFMDVKPIRFDSGYSDTTAKKNMATVLYHYPLTGSDYALEYGEKLLDCGWEHAKNVAGRTNGPLSMIPYAKDGDLLMVTTNRLLKTVTVTFAVTNEGLLAIW